MYYTINDKRLYLINTNSEEHSYWFFHFSCPDRISLGESLCNKDDEKLIEKDMKILPKEQLSLIEQYIDGIGIGKEHNYVPFSKVLCEIYGISQDKIDEILGYNQMAVDICKELKCQYDYDTCKCLLNEWDNDIERVKKYLKRFVIHKWNMALVDIFPTKEDLARPTWPLESWLLHEYYNREPNFIDEAIKIYTDYKDRDKAGYFIDKKIEEWRNNKMESLKEEKYGK